MKSAHVLGHSGQVKILAHQQQWQKMSYSSISSSDVLAPCQGDFKKWLYVQLISEFRQNYCVLGLPKIFLVKMLKLHSELWVKTQVHANFEDFFYGIFYHAVRTF